MSPASLPISTAIREAVKKVVEAELVYEQVTDCGRKFGITGEVGEILVCDALGLHLVKDPRSEGFDAVDDKGNRIQIKTRRGECTDLPKDTGRLGTFSEHVFDYALMGILSRDYRLVEIWRGDFQRLNPIIQRHKKRNPTIYQFKKSGVQVFP